MTIDLKITATKKISRENYRTHNFLLSIGICLFCLGYTNIHFLKKLHQLRLDCILNAPKAHNILYFVYTLLAYCP